MAPHITKRETVVCGEGELLSQLLMLSSNLPRNPKSDGRGREGEGFLIQFFYAELHRTNLGLSANLDSVSNVGSTTSPPHSSGHIGFAVHRLTEVHHSMISRADKFASRDHKKRCSHSSPSVNCLVNEQKLPSKRHPRLYPWRSSHNHLTTVYCPLPIYPYIYIYIYIYIFLPFAMVNRIFK